MDTDLLYFLLGIIAAILIDLLVMPRLKRWQNELPQINRQKKKRELIADLAYIEDLSKDGNTLIATASIHLVTIMVIYAISIVLFATSMFLVMLDSQDSILQYLDDTTIYKGIFVYVSDALIVVGFIFFIIGVNLSFKILGVLNKVRQFKAFKQQSEVRINELNQEG